MKKLIYILIPFLISCKSLVSVTSPLTEKEPDTLSKPTETVVANDTIAEMPKGTWVKTDSDSKTEVTLEEDTLAYIKSDKSNLPEIQQEVNIDPKVKTVEKPQEIFLPKNTQVVLPPNTYLQTSENAKVTIDAKTEVILPQGTEITITRINWYAILFYSLLVFFFSWYYLQGKTEDKNGDGFIDEKNQDPKV